LQEERETDFAVKTSDGTMQNFKDSDFPASASPDINLKRLELFAAPELSFF
jgi:hypothetical protein